MQKMKKGSVIMKELSKRTKTFTDSVIRRMTRIANEYGAINLSQGFPDFDPGSLTPLFTIDLKHSA